MTQEFSLEPEGKSDSPLKIVSSRFVEPEPGCSCQTDACMNSRLPLHNWVTSDASLCLPQLQVPMEIVPTLQTCPEDAMSIIDQLQIRSEWIQKPPQPGAWYNLQESLWGHWL